MTMGTIASTRGSVAPTIQVVQPRLEAPATTNFSIFAPSLLRPLLQAIHRPDHALDHRQARQPGGVAGFEELVPAVADQVVFLARLAVAVKHQRLVGHHLQFGDDAAGRLGDAGHDLVRRRRASADRCRRRRPPGTPCSS